MIKNYILDTNVLIHNPESIFDFDDNMVIIPIGVIEELDNKKKDPSDVGRNARHASRLIDSFRGKGDLRKGVPMENGGIIAVRYNGNLGSYYKEKNIDLHVIHIAQETLKKDKNTPCIIVSKDVNVRIRAEALGLQAQDYEKSKIDAIDYGFYTIPTDMKTIEQFGHDEGSDLSILGNNKPYPNYFVVLSCAGKKGDKERTAMGVIDAKCSSLLKITPPPRQLAIRSKNIEQTLALHALLNEDIKLVSLSGRAGCGKTLMGTAAGYYLTEVAGKYTRMLISRPVYPMGKDLGYLPGTIDEKMDPWMQPIYDAFDIISGSKNISGKKLVEDSGKIKVEPLTYIRGRSIHYQFLLLDEVQNLTALEIKTIITRASEGTKIVLTGDVEQIDNPYVDKYSNGLSVVINAFRDSKLAAHLVMTNGVRSELAEEASHRL